mmetsp:Transcript_33791/g.52647  ORF Transcript_33791/g.52647 Transcript_33791/m.52647 type:complete len:274 (+) Transcript_33791:539-1360(+)
MWPESNRKRLAESKGVTSCCPMGAKGVRGKRVKTGRLSRKQFLCRLQGQSLVVHNLHRRKSLSLKEIRQQRHSQQPTRSTELRAWTVCLVMSQVTQRTTAMSLQKKSRGCLRKQGSSSRLSSKPWSVRYMLAWRLSCYIPMPQKEERQETMAVDPENTAGAFTDSKHARALVQQGQRKRPPCKYFSKGRCRKGTTCPFQHVKSSNHSPSQQALTTDGLSKASAHTTDYVPYGKVSRRGPSLLAKLLLNDTEKEQRVILQCFRHLVKTGLVQAP